MTTETTCTIEGIRELCEWAGPRPDEVLTEMEARARAEDFAYVGPAAGRTLALLTRLTRARSVLELGSGFGYSAYWIAREIPSDGSIVLTERDEALLEHAVSYFDRGDIAATTEFIHADVFDYLPTLDGEFDLIHVDHDTVDYTRAFELVRDHLTSNGTIVFDNVLVHRDVLTPSGLLETLEGVPAPNERTRYTAAFLRHLDDDEAFELTFIPVDEGIAVAYRV